MRRRCADARRLKRIHACADMRKQQSATAAADADVKQSARTQSVSKRAGCAAHALAVFSNRAPCYVRYQT
jgi:hypothetical protein